MQFDQLRSKYQGYSDDEILGALQATKYPEYSVDEIRVATGWKPQAPGAIGHAKDTALQLAQGVLQGSEMLANVFGADNPVSEKLRSGHQWLASNFSDQLKWEQLTTAQEMDAAAKSGSTWEEVKAAAKGFGRDPVGFLVNAAGTSLPTIAAAFLPGGQTALLGRLAAMGVAGAAQGAGAVKGEIFNEVEQVWKQAGATEEEAKARATAAQEYLGSNAGQIAIGTALGAVAGATGLEGSLAAKVGGQGAAKATGMIPRFVREGVKEAIPEGLQGGQEQLASNVAVQGEGFDRPTWQGVAGGATLEALAGGVVGGAGSLFTARKRAEADAAIGELAAAEDIDSITSAALRAADTPLAGRNSLMGATTSLGASQEREGLAFEADPRFAGAPTFGNGAAPSQPVFGSKQAADIYIGESGELGKLRAVEVAPGRWQAQQTPQAADAAAQANIDRWAERAEPMSEERAVELARLALETQNRQMTPIPLPDGRGWTVVPSQWVQAPGLAGYVEQARGAVAAEQQRNADIRAEALAPAPAAQMLPEMPGGRTWERDMAGITLDAEAARAEQQKAADLERLPVDAEAQNARQQALQRAAALEGESPMAAALRKAGATQPPAPQQAGAGAALAPGLPGAQAAPEPGKAGSGPRIVPRTPDMEPMSLAKAQAQAAAAPGSEVVAIRNLSGKLAYTVLPPEAAAIRPTDILTGDGFPYGTKTAATIRARKEGPEWAAVEVPGGFAVRRKEQPRADDTAGNAGPGTTDAGRGDGAELLPQQRPGDVQPGADGVAGEGLGSVRAAGVPRGNTEQPAAALTAAEAAAPANQPAGVSESPAGAPSAPVAAAPTNATPPAPQPQPAPDGETAGATGGVAPSLTRVRTLAGTAVFVRQSDLDSDKPRLRMFTSTGRPAGVIVRENLDPTGEKQAALNAVDEANPLFDVITAKDGRVFASEPAAARERSIRGLANSHEIQRYGNGFILKRAQRQADPSPQAEEQGAPDGQGQGLQGRRRQEALAPQQAESAAPQESAAETIGSQVQQQDKLGGGPMSGNTKPAATLKERIAARREEQAGLIALRKRESVLRSLLECMQ